MFCKYFVNSFLYSFFTIIIIKCKVSFSSHSSSSHYSMQGFILNSFHIFGKINDIISKCELFFFYNFRINVTKMWVHGEAVCFWFIWPPFSGWLQKFCNTDIVSLASPRVILELPSAVFSVCQNRYQNLVFCWEVFWQMHKLVSRHDYLNISTMYNIFELKDFELLSYRRAFLESTKTSASEEQNALEKAPVQFMELQIISRKAPVQFIPFWKLSGKIQFLVWFYTSN